MNFAMQLVPRQRASFGCSVGSLEVHLIYSRMPLWAAVSRLFLSFWFPWWGREGRELHLSFYIFRYRLFPFLIFLSVSFFLFTLRRRGKEGEGRHGEELARGGLLLVRLGRVSSYSFLLGYMYSVDERKGRKVIEPLISINSPKSVTPMLGRQTLKREISGRIFIFEISDWKGIYLLRHRNSQSMYFEKNRPSPLGSNALFVGMLDNRRKSMWILWSLSGYSSRTSSCAFAASIHG